LKHLPRYNDIGKHNGRFLTEELGKIKGEVIWKRAFRYVSIQKVQSQIKSLFLLIILKATSRLLSSFSIRKASLVLGYVLINPFNFMNANYRLSS